MGARASRIVGLLCCLACALWLQAGPATAQAGGHEVWLPTLYPAEAGPEAARARQAFLDRARRDGTVAVIVGLDMPLRDEDTLSASELAAQRVRLRNAQTGLLGRITGSNAPRASVLLYESIPYMAMSVTAEEFERLIADPAVVVVQWDAPVEPGLATSVPFIRANRLWIKGYTGEGQAVAVLDTGVARGHPMLKGKVVAEACFGVDDANKVEPFCPGKATKAVGTGAARPCPIAGCDHGTHVASIAAGNARGHLGVARGSDVIAVQVFSRGLTAAICNPKAPPCLVGRQSSIIAGLQYVYQLRKAHTIAAVNLSLGSGAYAATCDAQQPAFRDIIRKLVGARISVFAAAGNNGNDTNVATPACVSHAIAVAATEHTRPVMTGFSNLWPGFMLAAPGDGIEAAVPPKGYAAKSGTSMATPHVAGAAALLRQVVPTATQYDVKRALRCGAGPAWTERTPDLDYPAINVLAAWRWILTRFPERLRWDFGTGELIEWDQVSQKWTLAGGHLRWVVPNEYYKWATIVYPSCRDHYVFEARVRRVDPYASWDDDREPRIYPQMGLLWNAEVEGLPARMVSGYWMYYYQDGWHKDKINVGVTRIDGWDPTTDTYPNPRTNIDCFREQMDGRLTGYNTLKVVTEGATHAVFFNGVQVCAFTDAALTPWSVGFLANQPNEDEPDHVFMVDWAQIRALKSASKDALAIAQEQRRQQTIDLRQARLSEARATAAGERSGPLLPRR